jgi:hypothetical protein
MSNTTKTPVDSIEIPPEYLELCEAWHGGLNDLLYAVSSTGGLTLGNRRPPDCDTDEKWYLSLWWELSSDITHANRLARRGFDQLSEEGKQECRDNFFGLGRHKKLSEFEEWVDDIAERLAEEYGLTEWEA